MLRLYLKLTIYAYSIIITFFGSIAAAESLDSKVEISKQIDNIYVKQSSSLEQDNITENYKPHNDKPTPELRYNRNSESNRFRDNILNISEQDFSESNTVEQLRTDLITKQLSTEIENIELSFLSEQQPDTTNSNVETIARDNREYFQATKTSKVLNSENNQDLSQKINKKYQTQNTSVEHNKPVVNSYRDFLIENITLEDSNLQLNEIGRADTGEDDLIVINSLGKESANNSNDQKELGKPDSKIVNNLSPEYSIDAHIIEPLLSELDNLILSLHNNALRSLERESRFTRNYDDDSSQTLEKSLIDLSTLTTSLQDYSKFTNLSEHPAIRFPTVNDYCHEQSMNVHQVIGNQKHSTSDRCNQSNSELEYRFVDDIFSEFIAPNELDAGYEGENRFYSYPSESVKVVSALQNLGVRSESEENISQDDLSVESSTSLRSDPVFESKNHDISSQDIHHIQSGASEIIKPERKIDVISPDHGNIAQAEEPTLSSESLETDEKVVSPQKNSLEPIEPVLKEEQISYDPGILPVSFKAGNRLDSELVLVLGQEDGQNAAHLDLWLLPFETIISLLKLESKPIDDQTVNYIAPGIDVKLNKSKLVPNDEIGTAISVKDLKSIFGVTVEYDISNSIVVIDADWLRPADENPKNEKGAPIIDFTGLPWVKTSPFSISTIQQHTNLSRSGSRDARIDAELALIGSIFGNSWYLGLDQRNLDEPQTWGIRDLEVVRFTPNVDYFLGTQSPFWPDHTLRSDEDLFGISALFRFGYSTPEASGGSPSISRRLRTKDLRRIVAGRAEPGTIVQLRTRDESRVLKEIEVDNSGIYRFDDINIRSGSQLSKYTLYIFSEGKLDVVPEVQDVRLTGGLSEQLPAGSAALILSGGFRRVYSEFSSDTPFGDFQDFIGGASTLYGLTDTLTVGLGVAYDKELLGFGELYWQPKSLPFNVSLAATVGDPENISSRQDGNSVLLESSIRAQPLKNLSFEFYSDEFSRQFSIGWQPLKKLSINAFWNSNRPTTLDFNFREKINDDLSIRARLSVDEDQKFDIKQSINWKHINLSASIDNEGGAFAQLKYHLYNKKRDDYEHSFVATYDQADDANIVGFEWEYTSRKRNYFGKPLWSISAGYAYGSSGQGIIASIRTGILPWLSLRASYQQVSLSSSTDRFVLDLVSTFDTQKRLRPGSNRSFDLRTQGGLLIEAFLDANQNGKLDSGEEKYTDPNLIVLNNKPLSGRSVETIGNVVTRKLPPGKYRVDLDPAGMPIDWQAIQTSYAAEIYAGGYTTISIPLVPSYTVTGVAKNSRGQILRGAKIEAIPEDSGKTVTSITNGSGTFYLEGLQRKTYKILVNGKPTQSETIILKSDSESYFSLDLVQAETKNDDVLTPDQKNIDPNNP